MLLEVPTCNRGAFSYKYARQVAMLINTEPTYLLEQYLRLRPVHKGLIFDLDGTLVNSMPLHMVSWNTAIRKFGGTFQFDAISFMQVAGVGGRHTIEFINQKYHQSLPAEETVHDKELIYQASIPLIKIIPEVMGIALEANRMGIPCAVASGGRRDNVHQTLEVVGQTHLFKAIVSQNDVLRSKPAPDIFLLAAEKMGVLAGDCIVFEDSPLGIQAAHTAGMQSVQIPSLL
ncbi:MAG: HAD family phosphatase [Verrucomicrobiota bacterium]|nr:HAD family phosphatase [Verrucomicrobiota bacterium]